MSVGNLKEEEEDEDDEDEDNEGDGDVARGNEEEEDVEADSEEEEEEAHLSTLELQRLEGKVGSSRQSHAWEAAVSPEAESTCSCVVSPEAPGSGRHREAGRQAAAGPGGRK